MTVQISTIQRMVAAEWNVSELTLLSRRRDRRAVDARQVAMWFARTMTGRSFEAIGRRFADRDHSTVMHAVRRVTERLAAGDELVAPVMRLSIAFIDIDMKGA